MASEVPTHPPLPQVRPGLAANSIPQPEPGTSGSATAATACINASDQYAERDLGRHARRPGDDPASDGRRCGANGIGHLREVALVRITESERFPLHAEDPHYFPTMGLSHDELDVGRMRDQSLAYQSKLEDLGVVVHRVDYPQPAVGAFGPMRSTWAANELLVLRGGSFVEKVAISPFGTGRAEYLALWAFANLGIPPLATVTGTGVCEAGPCFWLAEDVFVTGRGLAYNQAGLDQLVPVVARSSGLAVSELTTLTVNFPGTRYFDPRTGQAHHPDMVLGALDVDKVIAYPPGLDFTTWQSLRDRGYEIVEVDLDEQRQYAPTNVMLVEPGLVIMHAECPKAIAAVRKAGVEVVATPYSEFLRLGGGLHCSTMRVLRDSGPYSTDRPAV